MTADDTLWDLEERFRPQGADSARHATAKGAVYVFPFAEKAHAVKHDAGANTELDAATRALA